jgi:hypothetical protein
MILLLKLERRIHALKRLLMFSFQVEIVIGYQMFKNQKYTLFYLDCFKNDRMSFGSDEKKITF